VRLIIGVSSGVESGGRAGYDGYKRRIGGEAEADAASYGVDGCI
jgi:hypothetical protein